MKTKVMIKNLRIVLVTVFLMMLSVTGYSQACTGNMVTVSLQNFSQPSSKVLEFDVYLTNTGSTTMRLSTASVNVLHNSGLLPAGATGTVAIALQPSECDFPTYPVHTAEAYNPSARNIRILGNANSGGTVTLTSTSKRFCRMRFTSTLDFTQSFAGQFTLNPTNLTSPTRPQCQVTVYCNGNGNSATLAANTSPATLTLGAASSYTLNPNTCATSGSAVVTNPTCSGGTGSAVITMSPVPTVSNITYQVDGALAQSASLSSGAFTVSGLSNGPHTITVLNSGCSNVDVSLTVAVPGQLTNTTSITACNSYTWSVNGQTYTSSGTYSGTTVNGNGCTVNETLNLTINYSTSESQSVTACDTYTWTAGTGTTYSASGTYTSTGTNAAGCVHTKTLVLTINQSTSESQSITACNSYTWTAGTGTTYTASGTYTSTSTNAAGCVHTKTLVLTITTGGTNTTQATACDSYTWSVNGQTYTASGNFSVTTGCNTEYLELTINHSSSNTTTASACGSYIWEAPLGNGQTYTTNQTGLTSTSTNAAGCTHTETLNLTILNESITVQPLAPFICNLAGATATVSVSTDAGSPVYQWQTRTVSATNPNPVWNNMTNNVYYSGVNTPTLGITRGSIAFATGIQFKVLITGTCGVLNSNTVALTSISTVKAGTIASPASVCLGGSITFTLGGYAGTSLQWQSAPSATGTFADISGATSSTYTLVGATALSNKSYRVIVTSNCGGGSTATTAVKTIKVDPTSVAGTATGGGTLCEGGSGTLKVAGHVGTVQWEYSTDGVTYTNAPKAATGQLSPFSTTSTSSIAATYIVTNITANLYFRAKITSGACSSTYTNVVQYFLGTSAVAGTISVATPVLCAGTGTTLTLSGSVGTITWFKSTNGGTTWTATTVHTATYPTGNLAATTTYKADVSIGSCAATVSTTSVVVTVNALAKGGTVTPFLGTSYQACSGVAKKLKVATYVGAIQWQSSTDNVTFSDISGANAVTYDAVISEATWFRVKTTNGVCPNAAYSLAIQLTVSTPAAGGTLTAGASPICGGSATTVSLSGTTSGTLVWQKSVNYTAATPTWAAIAGAVSPLATGNLTVSTAYRVVATSGACVEYSNVLIITVIPKPVAKAIINPVTSPTGAGATTALCTDLSVAKTLSITAGYVGNVQWQKGTSATAGFVDIAGETGVTYTVSNPNVGANYYRIRFSNDTCSDVFSAVVTLWYKTCSTARADDAIVSSVKPLFGAIVYPNPYTETFNLSLTTVSEEKVGIVVYDMTGRLIERREVRVSDMAEQKIGDQYPSGVYNVVVTQGQDVKTLRVIKR